MRICIISKYPPIEGGVSSYNYWLSRALGDRGHRVFIVTNAQEAGFEYKEEIFPREAKNLEPKGVTVINTSSLNKEFIPQYPPFTAKLASIAIELVKKEKIDVLYSNYLLPYAVAAYIVKQATNIPWFLDHAGSDITNLFDEPFLKPVFIELFKKADLIVNSPQVRQRLIKPGIINADRISPFADRIFYAAMINKTFSPNLKPFNLRHYFSKFNQELPVFTFLGKVSTLKNTFSFVEAASYLPRGKFYLLFLTDRGRMYIQLRNLLDKYGLLSCACLLPFQPPWKIPAVITASTCVVAPESEEEPYLPRGTHESRICLEAMLCARCAIIGKNMSKKADYSQCKDREHFLVVDPANIKDFVKILKLVVNNSSLAYNIGKKARKFFDVKLHSFEDPTEIFIKNLQVAILKSQ